MRSKWTGPVATSHLAEHTRRRHERIRLLTPWGGWPSLGSMLTLAQVLADVNIELTSGSVPHPTATLATVWQVQLSRDWSSLGGGCPPTQGGQRHGGFVSGRRHRRPKRERASMANGVDLNGHWLAPGSSGSCARS
jgi:hypothetical protein